MTAGLRHHSRLDLACEESAVLLARSHAEDVFRTWGLPGDVAFDARTVVVELASNAVRHVGDRARTVHPGGRQSQLSVCTLRLAVHSDRLCISMQDESSDLPVLRPASETSENGRGLHLIAGLSEGAWGYEPTGIRPGKVVWAWLRLTGRGQEPNGTPPATDTVRFTQRSA